jgi:hypothetical protein
MSRCLGRKTGLQTPQFKSREGQNARDPQMIGATRSWTEAQVNWVVTMVLQKVAEKKEHPAICALSK